MKINREDIDYFTNKVMGIMENRLTNGDDAFVPTARLFASFVTDLLTIQERDWIRALEGYCICTQGMPTCGSCVRRAKILTYWSKVPQQLQDKAEAYAAERLTENKEWYLLLYPQHEDPFPELVAEPPPPENPIGPPEPLVWQEQDDFDDGMNPR